MSERGESLDPVRMLNVASWRKLRASRGRVQRGLESQNLRPPNIARAADSLVGFGSSLAADALPVRRSDEAVSGLREWSRYS